MVPFCRLRLASSWGGYQSPHHPPGRRMPADDSESRSLTRRRSLAGPVSGRIRAARRLQADRASAWVASLSGRRRSRSRCTPLQLPVAGQRAAPPMRIRVMIAGRWQSSPRPLQVGTVTVHAPLPAGTHHRPTESRIYDDGPRPGGFLPSVFCLPDDAGLRLMPGQQHPGPVSRWGWGAFIFLTWIRRPSARSLFAGRTPGFCLLSVIMILAVYTLADG
jgi:hypothetical protein